jgi:hypothetical protein
MDGDGITDFTVVRNGTGAYSGYRIWYVALSSKPGVVLQDLFGLISDRVGTADLDGDGTAEMVALRDGYLWFGKKLGRPEISQVQWGLPGDYPLLPADINQDGRADYVISRPTGAGQILYIRYSASSTATLRVGQDTSIPMIGNFTGSPGYAWAQRDTGFTAIRRRDGSPDVFLFGIAANAVVRPDGTVVQPNDSGRFGSVVTPPGGGGGNGGGVGVLHCDAQLDMNDGRNGNKYRPSSGKGRKMIWEEDLFGQIEAAASFTQAGAKVDDWDVYASPEIGPRTRAYSNRSPSSLPKPEVIVARLRNGRQVCAVIPDPTRQYD